MYAICGADVELYSIEYFRGYGRWLQALSVGRGVVMELYSIEYFRGEEGMCVHGERLVLLIESMFYD